MAQEANPAAAVPRSYPIVVEVGYKLAGGTGRGCTENMSSTHIEFIAPEELPLDNPIDLSIAWPALLNGKVGLRLCVKGRIIESRDHCVSVAIQRYEFRTKASKVFQPALSKPFRTEINDTTLCPVKDDAEGVSYDGA